MIMLPKLVIAFVFFLSHALCSTTSNAESDNIILIGEYDFGVSVFKVAQLTSATSPVPVGYAKFQEWQRIFETLSLDNTVFAHFLLIVLTLQNNRDISSVIIRFTIYEVDIRELSQEYIRGFHFDYDLSSISFANPNPMSPELFKKVTENLRISSSKVHYLTMSALQGNKESIEIARKSIDVMGLDKEYVDVSGKNVGRLMYSIINGLISESIILIAAQRNLEWESDYGRAAIHIAALTGNTMLVELLIFLGIDPSTKDAILRCTPLHFAANSGQLDVVNLLIEKGALWNDVDAQGSTPLQLSIASKHYNIAKIFLDLIKAQQSINDID